VSFFTKSHASLTTKSVKRRFVKAAFFAPNAFLEPPVPFFSRPQPVSRNPSERPKNRRFSHEGTHVAQIYGKIWIWTGGSLPNKPVLTRYMEKSGYESG
jgi:hypothetical protein